MNIAICIIAYNRIDSLKRVLTSLEQSYYDESVTLIISIDKSNTTQVEDFAKQYHWKQGEKRVITHPENLGLRKHVLKCGDLLQEYDALKETETKYNGLISSRKDDLIHQLVGLS